jgi:hypothetical protein
MDQRTKRTSAVCQICGVRPATINRRGQVRGLRLCAGCVLAIMPGVTAAALVEVGIPQVIAQAAQERLEAMFRPFQPAPPVSAALEKELAPYIARHRAEAMRFRQYEQGCAAGEEWARRAATPDELSALRTFREQFGGLWKYSLDEGPCAETAPGAELFFALIRPAEQSADAAEAFWATALSDSDRGQHRHSAFVQGFAEAALLFARMAAYLSGDRAGQPDHGEGSRAAVTACTL